MLQFGGEELLCAAGRQEVCREYKEGENIWKHAYYAHSVHMSTHKYITYSAARAGKISLLSSKYCVVPAAVLFGTS